MFYSLFMGLYFCLGVLYFTLYFYNRIMYTNKAHGGCGEVVNTADCGSVMRAFESRQPPHMKKISESSEFFYVIMPIC